MQRDGQIISGRRGAYGLLSEWTYCIAVQGIATAMVCPARWRRGRFVSLRARDVSSFRWRRRARVAGFDRRGRAEGQVVEVLTRAAVRWWGAIWKAALAFFCPTTRIRNHILIPPKAKGGARHGPLVSVRRLTIKPWVRREKSQKFLAIIWIRSR